MDLLHWYLGQRSLQPNPLVSSQEVKSVPFLRQHWRAGEVYGDFVARPRSQWRRAASMFLEPHPKLDILPDNRNPGKCERRWSLASSRTLRTSKSQSIMSLVDRSEATDSPLERATEEGHNAGSWKNASHYRRRLDLTHHSPLEQPQQRQSCELGNGHAEATSASAHDQSLHSVLVDCESKEVAETTTAASLRDVIETSQATWQSLATAASSIPPLPVPAAIPSNVRHRVFGERLKPASGAIFAYIADNAADRMPCPLAHSYVLPRSTDEPVSRAHDSSTWQPLPAVASDDNRGPRVRSSSVSFGCSSIRQRRAARTCSLPNPSTESPTRSAHSSDATSESSPGQARHQSQCFTASPSEAANLSSVSFETMPSPFLCAWAQQNLDVLQVSETDVHSSSDQSSLGFEGGRPSFGESLFSENEEEPDDPVEATSISNLRRRSLGSDFGLSALRNESEDASSRRVTEHRLTTETTCSLTDTSSLSTEIVISPDRSLSIGSPASLSCKSTGSLRLHLETNHACASTTDTAAMMLFKASCSSDRVWNAAQGPTNDEPATDTCRLDLRELSPLELHNYKWPHNNLAAVPEASEEIVSLYSRTGTWHERADQSRSHPLLPDTASSLYLNDAVTSVLDEQLTLQAMSELFVQRRPSRPSEPDLEEHEATAPHISGSAQAATQVVIRSFPESPGHRSTASSAPNASDEGDKTAVSFESGEHVGPLTSFEREQAAVVRNSPDPTRTFDLRRISGSSRRSISSMFGIGSKTTARLSSRDRSAREVPRASSAPLERSEERPMSDEADVAGTQMQPLPSLRPWTADLESIDLRIGEAVQKQFGSQLTTSKAVVKRKPVPSYDQSQCSARPGDIVVSAYDERRKSLMVTAANGKQSATRANTGNGELKIRPASEDVERAQNGAKAGWPTITPARTRQLWTVNDVQEALLWMQADDIKAVHCKAQNTREKENEHCVQHPPVRRSKHKASTSPLRRPRPVPLPTPQRTSSRRRLTMPISPGPGRSVVKAGSRGLSRPAPMPRQHIVVAPEHLVSNGGWL